MEYELLDFGDSSRLERFGPHILDRPCPAAHTFSKQRPDLWRGITAKFRENRREFKPGTEPQRGEWLTPNGNPLKLTPWSVSFSLNPPSNEQRFSITLELKGTPFGHLGVFPEQISNWSRIVSLLAGISPSAKVLNLFAYTGGSTLAAAAAGANVVHVDSAKNIVAWAKHNAGISGLQNAPIRWLCEDARKFVRREIKRGEQYDAVILDPPSFGHGVTGEVWSIEKHLPELLRDCRELLRETPRFLLLTCHSPEFDLRRCEQLVRSLWNQSSRMEIESFPLFIPAASGQKLPAGCGVLVRW